MRTLAPLLFLALAACRSPASDQRPPASAPNADQRPPAAAPTAGATASTASATAGATTNTATAATASATVDAARISSVARAELDRAMATWKAEAGVVVVLDRDTGAIHAMVGRTGAAVDDARAERDPVVTGSTLKTFTVALALAAGAVTPDDIVDCATRRYGERALEDASAHGRLSVADVLAVSSNVGASRLLDRLGPPALTDGLRRLHLVDPPTKVPPVSDPTSLEAAWLAGGELAEITPLAVAAAYGAVFRGGVYRSPAGGPPEQALPASAAQATVALLERVVNAPVGTGGAAAVAGHHVAGKTGTADLGNGLTYASFVGTALDGPPLVVLVGVTTRADGASGGAVAAPVFARIVGALAR